MTLSQMSRSDADLWRNDYRGNFIFISGGKAERFTTMITTKATPLRTTFISSYISRVILIHPVCCLPRFQSLARNLNIMHQETVNKSFACTPRQWLIAT